VASIGQLKAVRDLVDNKIRADSLSRKNGAKGMAVQHHIDQARGISFAEFSQSCTLVDIQVYHLTLLSDPEWRPGLRRLVDFTGVTRFQVSPQEAKKVARQIKELPEKFSEARVAVAAPQAVIFGMGRMFGMLTEDINHPFSVFRTREAAMSWLEEGRQTGMHELLTPSRLGLKRRIFCPL